MISSRGNWGQVNFTDWSPLPSSEFGIVRPDPKNPNIIYGVGYGPGGGGSGLIKIDMTTGQWENVAPNFGVDSDKYHAGAISKRSSTSPSNPALSTSPISVFWSTRDGAHSFTAASPDLTTPKGKPQVACGTAPRSHHRRRSPRTAGAEPTPEAPHRAARRDAAPRSAISPYPGSSAA